jgi:hypothetical protein
MRNAQFAEGSLAGMSVNDLVDAPMYLVAERHPLDQVDYRVNDASRTSRVIATASALDCERHRTLRC